ncbi:MAG: WYL domain-containing transcriptional regulator [Anaerolineaceae bacterium]
MSQRQQLERIMEIDRHIREGGYPNADKLAEILEVSRRVIFNDRSFMIYRLGAPIEYDRGRGGWYYTDKTWSLPGIYVTQGELMAFFLSLEISKRYIGTDLESPLRSAADKISKAIKGPVSIEINDLRSHYTFSEFNTISLDAQLLIDLHNAILNRQQVWMRYFSAKRGVMSERVVFPYHLHNFQGDWFLVAFDNFRNGFRLFLVGRIQEMKLLHEKFEWDETFKVEDWIGTGFQLYAGEDTQELVIWFSPNKAQFIRERKWHPSQTIEEQSDGSLILHLKTGGLVEVRNWVLQFADDAEVLQPASLREDIAKEIQKLAVRYESVDSVIGMKRE